MKSIRNKIITIVHDYIKHNYSEYSGVCAQIKQKRSRQKDDFASTGKDTYIGQLMTEIPETLDNLLQEKLSDVEWLYYKSKEGTNWFAKHFKEFSPVLKI